ncbi:MAG: YggT family protein [Thermoleophilia bacterium]|nr:YggT family protein [Thermoleophilia bacterium]
MTFDRALIATFVNSLTIVYTIMILIYAIQSFVPLGYSSPVMTLRRFLDETVAPLLLVFRRFIPPIGPLDLSAMVVLFALWILSGIVQQLILS